MKFEWGDSDNGGFKRQFMGIYGLLTLQCLSERTTLEKLSHLAAMQSQKLPLPGSIAKISLGEKNTLRRELMSLAIMLARYRSSMASDDCGGRPEFRRFFRELRRTYDIAGLKEELRDDLRDTLAMVENDWMEERRIEKKEESLHKKRIGKIERKTESIMDEQKNRFEVLLYSISVIVLPFLVVGGFDV